MADPLTATAAAAAKNLTDVADRLGILQAVKRRLVSQPAPAAAKLDTVLDEIQKIYLSLDGEIVSYLGLWLDPQSDRFQQDRDTLLGLEGDAIQARMRKVKTACSKIEGIYDTYLRGWFSKVTSRDEAELLRQLFRELAAMDSQISDAINKVAAWLTKRGEETLSLVDAGKYEEAQQRVQEARKEILPSRRAMSRAMRTLFDLQSDFQEASGVA